MIYLDHAATAPVPESVAKVVYDTLIEQYGNPSSQHPLGQEARNRLEKHRSTVASALGCDSRQLYFTSGGSESDNWAISAAVWQGRHIGRHIITTAVEHSAVLEKCKALAQQGYEVTFLAPDSSGVITCQQVAQALRPDTVLVSVMLVNNETGTVFPVPQIAQLLKERGSKALLHCDAVQGFCALPFTASSLGADLIAVSGHKIGAPKGVGALYLSPRVRAPQPLIYGGGQESGLRSGTEATAQIAGFAKAVALRMATPEKDRQHMAALQEYARSRLSDIESLTFVGLAQAPHILSFSLPGYPSGNIVTDLAAQGICLSAGSACHRGALSHVLTAMKLPKRVAAGTVRISFGPETTPEDIDALCIALKRHREQRFPML